MHFTQVRAGYQIAEFEMVFRGLPATAFGVRAPEAPGQKAHPAVQVVLRAKNGTVVDSGIAPYGRYGERVIAQFLNVVPGAYELRISLDGYGELDREVVVK